MGKALRIDKFLADMGAGTRSQVKEFLRRGRVCVDGVVCKKPEFKLVPGEALVTLDGSEIGYCFYEYYMLNKPQGVVSATEDSRYPTVIQLIEDKKRKDLFPVGRLDVDTEGLLLITNDGALAHDLLSPRKHVDKVYYVHAEGILPTDAKERFVKGIELPGGILCLPADWELLEAVLPDGSEGCVGRLTIREGKFHQVKLMFEALGMRVIFLKRLSMGPLVLDEGLEPGEYRPLTGRETELLRQLGGSNGGKDA